MEVERLSERVTWARSPGVVARRIAGETILVPVTRRAQEMGLFTLNEVATFVWEQLDGTRTVGALAREVVDAFEVDLATATRDLRELLSLLAQAGCALEVVP